MSEELNEALARAKNWLANASDEEKAAMWKAQRESWSKGPRGPTDGMGTVVVTIDPKRPGWAEDEPPPSLHREPIEADREGGTLESQAIFAETVDNGGWSLTLHFGKGDDARDQMRRVSDYLRNHRLAFSTPAASDAEALRPHIEKLRRCAPINDDMGRVVNGQTEAMREIVRWFDAATPSTEGRNGEDQADG